MDDDKVQKEGPQAPFSAVLHDHIYNEACALQRTVKALAVASAATRLLGDSLRWCEPAALPNAIARNPGLARDALKEAQRLQGLAAAWVSQLQKAVNAHGKAEVK